MSPRSTHLGIEWDVVVLLLPANLQSTLTKEGTMSGHIFWILETAVKPGERSDLDVLMKDMVTDIEANEPGVLNYEFFVSEDGTSCHVYERYVDSAAVMAHMGYFGSNFMERFMSILEPTSLTLYGDASDEVREALAGFAPASMLPAPGFAR